MWKFLVTACVAALLGNATVVYGGDVSIKSYVNAQYHFRFQYPASYSLTELPDTVDVFTETGYDSGMSLIVHDLRTLAGVCALNDRIDCNSPEGMARYRAALYCDADGPDGRSYCVNSDVTVSQAQIGGKQAMEMHMVRTSEDFKTRSKTKSELETVCYFIVLSPGADGRMMEICGYQGGATPDIVRTFRFE